MRQPPALAVHLLRRFGVFNEPLVGDVLEQFRAGKSRTWLWRHVFSVVVRGAWADLTSQASIVFVAGAAATVIALMTYTAIQQLYRRSADYPQIDIAHADAYSLNNGGTIASVVPPGTIDVTRSLDPYVIVYDANAKPIATSATLNGRVPVPPVGVFGFASRNAVDHRFTWEPAPGVRSAVTLERFGGPEGPGFVLVGRSLRVAEQHVLRMTEVVTAVWTGSLLCLLAGFGARRSGRATA